MEEKAKAMAKIIRSLNAEKRYLAVVEEIAENYRSRFRAFRHLQSVCEMEEHDTERIKRIRKQICVEENLINSLPDETTKQIVSMYANEKSIVSISLAVYMSEHGVRYRLERACELMYPAMVKAGIIKE